MCLSGLQLLVTWAQGGGKEVGEIETQLFIFEKLGKQNLGGAKRQTEDFLGATK